MDVPGIDADSAFAVKLKHDDKLEDGATATCSVHSPHDISRTAAGPYHRFARDRNDGIALQVR